MINKCFVAYASKKAAHVATALCICERNTCKIVKLSVLKDNQNNISDFINKSRI